MLKQISKLIRTYNKQKKAKHLLNHLIEVNSHNYLNNQETKWNDIRKCFSQNTTKTRDPLIFDRIVNSYNKAKNIQPSKSTEYQVGNEWAPIYEKFMGGVIAALRKGDKIELSSIYENFMRHPCSTGLHGMPVDMEEIYFGNCISKIDGDLYLYDSIYRYIHWTKLTENRFTESHLAMPNFGNPYGYHINGTFVRTGAEYLHYYASKVKELIDKGTERKVVVELGGGYGGLAYFLNQKAENLTYIDFDLPENMALTAYYLLNSFPEKNIFLYGENEIDPVDFTKYDIVILPNFEINKLPSKFADLVFNSYSLAEMSIDAINLYIKELARACKYYFLHVNHNRDSHSYIADDFGIEKHSFRLTYKKKALWNLGRNSNMDEFEYLFKKD